MPRLPDATAIPLPSARSGRNVASFDTTAIGRGQEGYGASVAQGGAAEAAGLQALGQAGFKVAGELADYARMEERKTDQFNGAKATADLAITTSRLDEARDRETDPNKLAEYHDAYKAALDKAASVFTDEKKREMFRLQHEPIVARAQKGTNERAYGLRREIALSDANSQLENLQDTGLRAKDEATKTGAIRAGQGLIDTMENAGYLSPEEARVKRTKWARGYVSTELDQLPPQERIKALQPFDMRLVTRESGGNPGKVNNLGYAGLYQFGAPRVVDLGVYKPGAGERLKDWSTSPDTAPGKWSGTFNIPDFPEVKTIKDFLGSTGAQRQVYAIHTQKMNKEIQEQGFDRYIGKEVGGVTITQEGLQAMLHLGGVGGTRRTLESNGVDAPKDRNGTSVLDYAKLGVSSNASRMAQTLPVAMQFEKLQEAQKEQASIDKAVIARQKVIDEERSENVLKEAFSRSSQNSLTPDYVESARPFVSAAQYNNLLKTLNNTDAEDSPDAVSDLIKRVDTENPEQFQKSAEQWMREGKLKTGTYISLSEKNRVAAKDDQPASPYRASRDLVRTTLDPGQLLSGPAAAIARSAQAQALNELDNWTAANPRATREDLMAEGQNVIKRYQVIPYDQMKLAIGVSPYFGPKVRNEITLPDVDTAEAALAQDIAGAKLTKAQQEFRIRELSNWREILAREAAQAKAAPRGK